MRSFGRTARSIGPMTVGPVTTMIAPNSTASGHARSTRKCAAHAITAHVIATPTVSIRHSSEPMSCSSWNRSVRLPSNRITATDIETTGNSRSPSSRSGSRMPATGPSRMPPASRNTIDGAFVRHASHCANSASRPTTAIRTGGLQLHGPFPSRNCDGNASRVEGAGGLSFVGRAPAMRRVPSMPGGGRRETDPDRSRCAPVRIAAGGQRRRERRCVNARPPTADSMSGSAAGTGIGTTDSVNVATESYVLKSRPEMSTPGSG